MTLLNLLRAAIQRFYRRVAVGENVLIGRNVHIGFGSTLRAARGLVVADDVYIGKYCTLECDGSIGRGVLIANHVGLVGRLDHDFRYVGTLVRFAPWIGDPRYQAAGRDLKVVVGDDVWIGFGAIVLSGVEIGRGAIVGAGAVVTRDIPAYSIAVGQPARVVGTRFSTDEIARHEAALYGGAQIR